MTSANHYERKEAQRLRKRVVELEESVRQLTKLVVSDSVRFTDSYRETVYFSNGSAEVMHDGKRMTMHAGDTLTITLKPYFW